MNLVSLEMAKKWCQIDYNDDDDIIQIIIDKAQSELKSGINNFEDKLKDENFVSMAKIDMLKQIAYEYDNRSSVDDKKFDTSKIFTANRLQMDYCFGDYDEN